MMEITINCPQIGELAKAISKFADAGQTKPVVGELSFLDPSTMRSALSPASPVTAEHAAPVQTPAPPTPPVQTPPTPEPVQAPVTAPASDLSYTLEQLGQAAAPLMGAGKQPQLTAMLQEFGVLSLTELAPDTYPAVAQKLRELGAKI